MGHDAHPWGHTTTIYSSENVPAGGRVGALRDAIYNSVVHVDVTHEPDRKSSDINFRLRLSTIGRIVLFSAESSPITIHRTPQMIQDDAEPEVIVGLQAAGSSSMLQQGRFTTIHSGEFAIWDSTKPYTLMFDHRANQHFFRIPRAALGLRAQTLNDVTAVAMGRDQPVTKFVASHLSRLAESAELQSSAAGWALEAPTLALLRAALTAELLDPNTSDSALEETLEYRIVDYMTRHLAERDLTAPRIAAAHHISLRHLYVVLGRAGVVPAEWIRRHRLEAARDELGLASSREQTITETAGRWGFSDSARFSRLFRSAFGISPTEWRFMNSNAEIGTLT